MFILENMTLPRIVFKIRDTLKILFEAFFLIAIYFAVVGPTSLAIRVFGKKLIGDKHFVKSMWIKHKQKIDIEKMY